MSCQDTWASQWQHTRADCSEELVPGMTHNNLLAALSHPKAAGDSRAMNKSWQGLYNSVWTYSGATFGAGEAP